MILTCYLIYGVSDHSTDLETTANGPLPSLNTCTDMTPEQSSDIPVSSSSTLIDDCAATVQLDQPSSARFNPKQHDSTASDTILPLKFDLQLLGNRVDSLEKRVPLVEQTTTLLWQFMLSTRIVKDGLKTQSINNTSTSPDVATVDCFSETSENLDSRRVPSQSMGTARLEEQLRGILSVDKLRGAVPNQTAISFSDGTSEFSTSTNHESRNGQFDRPHLHGGLPWLPNAYDGLDSETAAIKMINVSAQTNANGIDPAWLQQNDQLDHNCLNLHTPCAMAAPAIHEPSQRQPLPRSVHGTQYKSSTGYQIAKSSSDLQDHYRTVVENRGDAFMSNGEDSGGDSGLASFLDL